jgi:uncharacterized membrane protein (DUF485 family)
VLFLLAERMRNAGKFTIADVLAFRLRERPARVAAAIGTLAVAGFYLIAQMVGAGALITALGWAAGVGLIMLTWVVTAAYLRKSDREWSPLEQRIAASVREPSRRFVRDEARVEEEVR